MTTEEIRKLRSLADNLYNRLNSTNSQRLPSITNYLTPNDDNVVNNEVVRELGSLYYALNSLQKACNAVMDNIRITGIIPDA